MVRKVEKPSKKHNISLYDEDWEFLAAHYGRQQGASPSEAVRRIIHSHVRALRQRINQSISTQDTSDTSDTSDDDDTPDTPATMEAFL